MVKYMECQKNHAAHLGSRVVDGCGEFMPAGNEGTLEFLRCAACDCHRNFHRRQIDGEVVTTTTLTTATTPRHRATTVPAGNCYISFGKQPPQNHAPVMMAFGGGGAAAESSSEGLKGIEPYHGGSRKRFRTKFTEEQKEKMGELAEKIGWKMQKESEGLVVELCNDIGIKRQVFKVWMHNNKQATKR